MGNPIEVKFTPSEIVIEINGTEAEVKKALALREQATAERLRCLRSFTLVKRKD
jgi:hypothetical protein